MPRTGGLCLKRVVFCRERAIGFPGVNVGIPMLKIRWSHHRLIFNMGIPIPREDSFYIEPGPWMYV